ncbi:MAG: type I methionyl aminopeptidase [Saprospiraceae bacterium]|jgi:methionyl aminopeptidase|nr:type I methionyl aminopeptidase [Saprospiraceae bacterium]
MSIQTIEEMNGLKAAADAVAIALRKMQAYAGVGMSTKEIDEYGYQILQSFGANPAPKKDYNFPGWTCISINHEACHGIPSEHRILKEGDLVNIDVSAELNGFYADNGGSFILGQDYQNLQPLVRASQDILHLALAKIKHGVRISAVGGLIEKEARKRGFQVIRNICGHGIGRKLHESPDEIPCYRDLFNRERFTKNAVVAIETFISTGAKYVYEEEDGWTLSTDDDSFVAQHEHTIVVTEGEPIILTIENGI